VRGRLLWFLLVLIGIGLLVLVLRHDSGTVAGFQTGDFASLIYKIALLIFIGGAVLALFRDTNENAAAALPSSGGARPGMARSSQWHRRCFPHRHPPLGNAPSSTTAYVVHPDRRHQQTVMSALVVVALPAR